MKTLEELKESLIGFEVCSENKKDLFLNKFWEEVSTYKEDYDFLKEEIRHLFLGRGNLFEASIIVGDDNINEVARKIEENIASSQTIGRAENVAFRNNMVFYTAVAGNRFDGTIHDLVMRKDFPDGSFFGVKENRGADQLEYMREMIDIRQNFNIHLNHWYYTTPKLCYLSNFIEYVNFEFRGEDSCVVKIFTNYHLECDKASVFAKNKAEANSINLSRKKEFVLILETFEKLVKRELEFYNVKGNKIWIYL